MKTTNILLSIIALALIISIALFFTHQNSVLPVTQNTPVSDNSAETFPPQTQSMQVQNNGTATVAPPIPTSTPITTSNWKTYTNTNYGFSFEYPATWSELGSDAEVINLSGTITGVDATFSDSTSKNTFEVYYHLAPAGASLYQYVLSQYQSSLGWYATGGKELTVAGNTAIEANMVSTVDGRGNTLNPPLRSIIVDFLDAKQTGEFELQFKTFSSDGAGDAQFEHVLSTFRFI